jgi:hypothetical protein
MIWKGLLIGNNALITESKHMIIYELLRYRLMFTHLLSISDSNNPETHSLHYRTDKMLLVDIVGSILVTLVCKSSGRIHPKLLIGKPIVVL